MGYFDFQYFSADVVEITINGVPYRRQDMFGASFSENHLVQPSHEFSINTGDVPVILKSDDASA